MHEAKLKPMTDDQASPYAGAEPLAIGCVLIASFDILTDPETRDTVTADMLVGRCFETPTITIHDGEHELAKVFETDFDATEFAEWLLNAPAPTYRTLTNAGFARRD